MISFMGLECQLQQKSNSAKSLSGFILGIGYLNLVSDRKSISFYS